MGLIDSIARLTAESRLPQAEALRQNGAIYGNLASQLGAIPGQVYAQVQATKVAEQERAIRAQEMQVREMQLAAAKRAQEGQKVLTTAIQQAGDDPETVAQMVSQQGHPDIAEGWLKQIAANKENLTKLAEMKRAAKAHELATIGDIAYGAESLPEFTAGVALMKQAGLLNEETAAPLANIQNPEEWPQARQAYLQFSPKYQAQNKDVNVPAGATVYNPTKGALFTAPDPRQAETARHNRALEETATTSAARMQTSQEETTRHNQQMEKAALIRATRPQASQAASATEGLDPDAVEYTATAYRLLGTRAIPTRISGGDRAKILNEAAKQSKALQQSPAAAATKQLTTKADATALNKIETMARSAQAFESKALAQADIIADLSSKVPRTTYPILNAAIQAGRTHITGDENATKLANAVETFAAEYAKIMEGSTGSVAGSSDSSRAASKRLINTAMSQGTMQSVLDLMKREMALTIRGYDVARQSITNSIGDAPTPQATPASPGLPSYQDYLKSRGRGGQ